MDVKKDILWRVYLGFIIMALLGIVIIGKAVVIQQVEGNYWRSMSDSLHQRIIELDAERGTIYSEDGNMLSTSIPQYDIYIDFMAEGLRAKKGKLFKANLDSLSFCLSKFFKDRSAGEYKKLLQNGYRDKDRWFLLRKKLSFKDYQQLKTFPLVRMGRNKSGFVPDKKIIRLNPYKMLAFRTIGLLRDENKVGLELTYDEYLNGMAGKRLVRFIAGGASVPVDDYEVEPENGKDIVTTLDVSIQDVTENALMKMLIQNEAEHGCAIVMEVKTGKIKAIANLGRSKDGNYYEDYNYAITPSEPGSTFKLATMLAVLEDKKATLNTTVDLNGGVWKVYGSTVYDSEKHGLHAVTLKEAFEHSSNVGMAKIAVQNYSTNPSQFIRHLKNLRMDTLTGIDLKGEIKPTVYKPADKRRWSNSTLPWMSFGYNLMVTPLQVLSLYNAVANNGIMMKPYLVNSINQDGQVLHQFNPVVVNEQICSKQTLDQLKESLEGVMTNGTGKTLNSRSYKIAGKTGTALVANGKRWYSDKIYQSSFAGYFPANDPQYTIIITIKNKPHAAIFYGAAIAGPVFREIADQVFTLKVNQAQNTFFALGRNDSNWYSFAGYKKDINKVNEALELNVMDKSGSGNYARMNNTGAGNMLSATIISNTQMPILNGMGLKDAVYLCENLGLKILVRGKGKVVSQSKVAGQRIARGETVSIQLN